jgi:capsular exopolysaccharide synthesis family protein
MTNNFKDTAADADYEMDEPRTNGPSRGMRLLIDLLGRWYWIALALLCGGAGSVYYLSRAPKIYSASSSILVKEQTGAVMGKDQTDEINMSSVVAMNTVIEQLKRQALLEAVAERDEVRGLQSILPPEVRWLPPLLSGWLGDKVDEGDPVAAASIQTDVLAGMIGSWTSVSMRRGTRLLDISVSHTSPEVAKVLADAVSLEYLAQTTGAKSSGRRSTIELLTEKSEQSRQSLQESQKAFSAYQRALSGHEELQIKEREVVELTRRYRAKHPELINGLAQVVNLQNRFLGDFAAAIKSGADAAYWADADVPLASSAQDLPERLEMARRMLLSRTSVLKSEIQSQESVFNAMLTKMQQVDVNQAEQESAIEINSLAQLARLPVSPVGSKVITKGLLGGLFVGTVLALLLVRLDNKFHTVMQVEELLGLPVFAAVVVIQQESKAKLAAQAPGRNVPEALEIEKNWDPKIVFRQALCDSSYAEMYRVLRAAITLLGSEEKRKVTLFTSAIPGEGKTVTSINYALAAAGQGKRVLLIDLDLRRPAVHKAFGLPRDGGSKGVTAYLAGKYSFAESILQNISGTGLDLMVSGMKAPNPGELLSGAQLDSFLAEARSKYDVIVLDTAPLLAVPDTRVIAKYADNLCMVIRAEYVPKGAALRVLRLLEAGHTPLAGVVLNAFRERRSLIDFNYSYGYYKYGSSGNAYGDGREAYGSKDG